MPVDVLNIETTTHPTFTVKSGNTELGREFGFVSIIVVKSVNKIPSARVVLMDGDAATRNFELSTRDELIPGRTLQVFFGYDGTESLVFQGLIVKHEIESRQTSGSKLIIELKDISYRLTRERKNRYFDAGMSDSNMMEDVIATYSGITADVEATQVAHSEMVQYFASDWDFIVTRAEANGQLVIPDDGTIKIARPVMSAQPTLTLIYGQNIMAFQAAIDAHDQFANASGYGWDFSSQEVMEIEGSGTSFTEQGNIPTADLVESTGFESLRLQHTGRKNSAELRAWCDAKVIRNRLSKIKGQVTVKGYASVKPGEMVAFEGLGDRFNGNAFVSAVSHYFSADTAWTTEIQVGLPQDWIIEKFDNVEAKPAGGLLPAIHGIHFGTVTQIDSDPEGEERIRVRIPTIDPGHDGVWARLATIDAGNNRGTFIRPEVNDEVVVGFINDDPRSPVILGMLNSSANPSHVSPTSSNHKKGYRSRSGIIMTFDDEESRFTITMPGGKKIEVFDRERITLSDDYGNKIQMDDGGVSITSRNTISLQTDGDINIEGTNVSVSARMSVSLEGQSAAELVSNGITDVKGSMVQIN